MADPFLGMFEGGSGLDDLGLGPSLAPFGSQVAASQDRIQQSFPSSQSQQQQSVTNQAHKLQPFAEERPSGTSQFLPPSQKLQHFNDPLLSSSSQPFQSSPQQFPQLQNRSPSQFPTSSQGSQMNTQAWRGKSSSNFSSQFASNPVSGIEQGTFRQPFTYGFQRSPSPRLKHFMNSPQSSHSPGLQSQSRSPMPYSSSSSPQGSSPKHLDQQQMSPQQPLRHYMNSEMGSHQAELVAQKRLQHMTASVDSPTSGTASSGSFRDQNRGEQPGFGSFFGGPQEPIQNDLSGVEQGVLFNSNQFPGQGVEQYPTNMLAMSANDSQGVFPREGQPQPMSSAQRYPLTDMSESRGLYQVKTSSVLLQMQRIQQQIQQMREMGQLNQLAQLQHRFQQLYQIYAMQEQQRMQQGYSGQHPEQLQMIRQQQQQKANRIVVEAMAKAALHNSANPFSMGGIPQMPPGPRMMGIQRFGNQFTEAAHMQQSSKPLELGPSLVHKPLASRVFSSRPPATVLSKPVPMRNRRDSSDAEPSPPSSPNFVNEEEIPSSITRRSLRERKKKVYKDDYDYNLSEEESDQPKLEPKVQDEPMLPPVTHAPEENEETMIVEKILAMKTVQVDGQPSEEFLVKYKNYSYMHSEWASAEKLAKGDKRIHMKLKRYRLKQLNSMTLFNELEEEPFNPDYVEVDRVLDMSVGVDQHSGEQITHYLVKWRSLPYDESTWEIESDVDDAKIQQFLKLRELPPPAMTQFQPRPYPHEWRKLDSSRVYKGENVLRDYQLEGLNWLTFCWCNRQNSILADEMGLGKTIQSISFLSEVQRYGIRGPFLVIAPLSTISNWQREFETWTDVNAVVYHGSASSRHLLQEYEFYFRNDQGQPIAGIFKFQVMITTYEIIIADNMQLSSVPWRCVVIDEAHRLKNRNCKLLEGLNNLRMEHRILLTGTPLQNNVDELFSLLNFLEPSQFPSQAAFLCEFGNLRTEAQVERLKMLLKPMMLRRLKEDVEKNIAPKEETIIEVELTTIQKKFYRAILERNFAFLSKGTSSTANVPNLMNTMMELRKCCNHPFLINGAEEKVLGEYHIPLTEKSNRHANIMIEASGKLVLIHKLLPKLKSGGHKVLIFSQMVRCLDIMEDYLVHMKFPYERIDGRVRGNLRQAAIDRFSKPDSDRFVFLLCTRAGGLGINLTAADTVIIFDSDWNPQNDIQAQARCHRIGQSRSVKVYRLITRNSYEREMFDRASLKLGLDKAVLQSMNTKENASNAQGLSKKEIEDLLKKGAYGAVMDEDSDDGNKFCEEDIDQILSRRTQVIQLESGIKGSTFAKASFVSSKGEEDIDVDDPDFWQKWAKKADLDVDALMNKDNRIIDAPRQRKQTKRYGNEDGDFELSDLEPEEEDVPVPRRSAWTRVECFRVEKNLLVYGWGRWKEILSSGRFKNKLAERDVEAVARTILVYCLHFYKGDDKVKTFIKDLVKASTIRERLPSEERDATYTPVPAVAKGKGRGKRGRAGKSANKSAIALVELGNDWRTCDPNTLVLDEGYRKHLQHHCNKILLRVRLLFYLKTNVIGYLSYKIKEGCKHSELPITIYPPEGEPPCDWWDEECDKSLLVGVYKHGYEHYSLMQADATLCFLSMVGLPKNAARADGLDPDLRDDDDQKDDPDYQEPDGQSQRDDDDDDDDEFKDTVSAISSPAAEKRSEGGENCNTGLRWPAASDLNTRLRRLIAGYQRVVKKEQLKKAAAEKERERKEKFEEAIRQKELKRAEMAQKWSKREEVDFYRTVTTFGVEYNGKTNSYDWTRFRRLARLDKKNDFRLTAYYLDFAAMCRRVCGRTTEDDHDRSESVVEPISEERANRCLHRMRLLSKIREEVLPHEALDEHLALAQPSPEFPDWWECGKHDKDLLVGVSKHGLSRTDYNVVNDPDLSFGEVLAKFVAAQQLAASQGPEEVSGHSLTNKVGPDVAPLAEEPSTLEASGGDAKSTPERSPLLQTLLTTEGPAVINKEPFPVSGYANPTTTSPPSSEKSRLGPGTPRSDVAGLRSPGEQSMFVLPPAAPAADGDAAAQENEGVATAGKDGALGEHLPATGNAVGGNMATAAVDEDSHMGYTPEPGQAVAGAADVAAVSSMRWPKDKVVMQRLELLCECVLQGKWPQVDRQAECLLQSQLAVPSPSMLGFPAHFDLDISGLPSGVSLGENGDDPSKAFKVKRLDGLKLTFKKNKRRKKREGDDGSEDSPAELEPKRKGPHAGGFDMDHEWTEPLPGWDLAAGSELKPPKKKRAYKKDKAEKLGMGGPVKKRVRKPKAPKLSPAGGEYMNAGAVQAPGGVPPQQQTWPGYRPQGYPGAQTEQTALTDHPISPGLHSPLAGAATPTPGFDFAPQVGREKSEPAEPSELHSQRIVVIERESGQKLVGSAAPTLANLAEWLERNIGFDVAEESSALVREKGDLPEALLSRVIPATSSRTSTPSTPRQFQVGYGEQGGFAPAAGAYPFESPSYGGFHAFGSYGAMPYQYGMPLTQSMGQNHGSNKQASSPTSPSPVGSSQFMISNSMYSPVLASQQQQQRQSPQQPVTAPHGFPPAAVPSSNAFPYIGVNNGGLAQFSGAGESESVDSKPNSTSPAASAGSDSSRESCSPDDVSS